MTQQQVSKFSGLFNLIVKLKWIIPIVALVLAILSVVIAMERRKTLLRLAIGVALFTLLILAGLSLGRITFLNKAGGGGFNTEAAGAVWDTVLRFLKTDLRWTLLVVVLVAFGAWVAGPGRYAVWIRSTCAKGGRWVGAQARALSSGTGRAAAGSERARRTGGWIVEHLNGLRIVGVIVAGLFLVFGGNLTGWSLLVILIVLAVYLGLLQLVAAWARNVSGAGAGAGSRFRRRADGDLRYRLARNRVTKETAPRRNGATQRTRHRRFRRSGPQFLRRDPQGPDSYGPFIRPP